MARAIWTPDDARPKLDSPVASEPVTTADAKKHLEIATGDTTHDSHIDDLITAARKRWQLDTGRLVGSQTWSLKLDAFSQFQFNHFPVNSITSVTYYDSGNASQTLASSVYELDTYNNRFRLQPDESWPSTYSRWDAVTVNYVGGTIEKFDEQAILMLVGHYFEHTRDIDMAPLYFEGARFELPAYEAMVRLHTRSTYP